MSSTALADLIVVVVVSAAAFSTGWVLRDAQARGLPRRKALTWAALHGSSFPCSCGCIAASAPRDDATRAAPAPPRRPERDQRAESGLPRLLALSGARQRARTLHERGLSCRHVSIAR